MTQRIIIILFHRQKYYAGLLNRKLLIHLISFLIELECQLLQVNYNLIKFDIFTITFLITPKVLMKY